MKIYSNYQPRPLLDWSELTPEQQSEYDYLLDNDGISTMFFKYKGDIYCLDDFSWVSLSSLTQQGKPRIPNFWDGYMSDTFFSGVLIKYHHDEEIIVGRYFT